MASTYCTQSQIEDVFGVENIQTWSDLDNSGTTDTARIARAIAVVSERIDDVARITNYKIPLADEDAATSASLSDLAATLAGIWLYEARGSQDFNPQTGEVAHRLEFKRQRAEQMLNDIRDQRIRLDAIRG